MVMCTRVPRGDVHGSYGGAGGGVADDELADLQARVRLDDVSDSWKLLANCVAVHARD